MEELDKESKMAKGLFTSLEEISFQCNYVQGNVKKFRDPNVEQNPSKTKNFLCTKRKTKRIQQTFVGRTR